MPEEPGIVTRSICLYTVISSIQLKEGIATFKCQGNCSIKRNSFYSFILWQAESNFAICVFVLLSLSLFPLFPPILYVLPALFLSCLTTSLIFCIPQSFLSFSFFLCLQGRRAVTCLFITSLRSLGTASWCRCSCLSVMSSPPKCLWIGRQTKVNALVGKNDKTPVKIILIPTHTINIFTSFLYHSKAFQ